MAAMTSGAKISAVMMRARSNPGLLAAPESALPLLIPAQRSGQFRGGEFRPEVVGEIELGIGEIPEQKIADAGFAASANADVRRRQVSQRKVAAEQGLAHLLRRYPACGDVLSQGLCCAGD